MKKSSIPLTLLAAYTASCASVQHIKSPNAEVISYTIKCSNTAQPSYEKINVTLSDTSPKGNLDGDLDSIHIVNKLANGDVKMDCFYKINKGGISIQGSSNCPYSWNTVKAGRTAWREYRQTRQQMSLTRFASHVWNNMKR